ncbi:MAG: hypothetical protein CBR30_07580 [Dictyoglomus sp. NZ13-RE01]|nr:MAG: hypothetical protein CBR30_07580 [Dictyoglomus sp. NZ13-RE01]
MSRFLVVFLIGVLFAVIFSIQNNQSITIYFGPWQYSAPVSLIILISFSLGFLLTLLTYIPTYFKNRSLINRQQKRIKELEEEISHLKQESQKSSS